MSGRTQTLARGGGLVVLLVLAVLFPQVWSNPAVVDYGVYALIFEIGRASCRERVFNWV